MLVDSTVVIIVDTATNDTDASTIGSYEHLNLPLQFFKFRNWSHLTRMFLIWYKYIINIAAAIIRSKATLGTWALAVSASDIMKYWLTQMVGMANIADSHRASKM